MAIVVLDYDPTWPAAAKVLTAMLWPHVNGLAKAIEHVGSSSVPGLAAKPVIDLDIIVDANALPATLEALAPLGYQHRGELGIRGRHAFTRPKGAVAHNLYVCIDGSLGLRNHLALRSHLRAHPEDAAAYGALKKKLAAEHADIDAYVEGKTAFITGILARYSLSEDDLREIETSNQA
ncbi:MAG: GrpB family protein [Proteobacteria bacterium]|nr:GrpB family protein [Pseudomonadota bacterium]